MFCKLCWKYTVSQPRGWSLIPILVLVKEEISHHTKLKSLINLGKSLGCSYLSELRSQKMQVTHLIESQMNSSISSLPA